MGFEPRTSREIEHGMLARQVEGSDLDDLAEGSAHRTLIKNFAVEAAGIERRILAVASRRWSDKSGQDLDEAVGQLPETFEPRMGPSPASSPALRLRRASTSGSYTLSAGAVFVRDDNPRILYVLDEDVVFGDGEEFYPPDSATPYARLTATKVGSDSDCPAGRITRMLDQPDEIIEVLNPVAITGGEDLESDAALAERAAMFQASRARVQGLALAYFARSFVDSQGRRVRHAQRWDDPARPGYTELVVDDGFGMVGFRRAGAIYSGTVPDSGQPMVWHESPAAEPLGSAGTLKVNGAEVSVGASYVSQPERGRLFVPSGTLSPGDTWEVSGYEVFTGWLAEFQRELEGDPSRPGSKPGHIAHGGRVRAVPPELQYVDFRLNLVVETGADTNALQAAIKQIIRDHLADLAPGDPLFLAGLTRKIMGLDGVRNVRFDTPDDDVYPATGRTRLGTTDDRIEVT